MREIRFRLWGNENFKESCKMYDWNYLKKSNDLWTLLDDAGQPGNAWILMQFTGIYDVENKEIWEGDIVLYDHCTLVMKCKIEFRHGAFVAIALEEGRECEAHDLVDGPSRGYKVIGNVYQNSELLTDGN